MKKIKQVTNKFNDNTKTLLKNAFGAFSIKGAGLLVSVISTPAFIRYFGDNTILGVWYTILSVITWIDFFDLGIGNGLRNSLVKSFAEKDWNKSKELISSAYLVIGILTIVLIVTGNVVIEFIDWNSVLNISKEQLSLEVLETAVKRIYIGVALHFFLKIISSIIYALQKSALNNLISLLGSILRLIYVLIARGENPENSLLAISSAYAFFACAPYLLATIIIFTTKLRNVIPDIRCCSFEAAKKVMGVGGIFFVCQILYMLLVNTNDICITYFTSPENTTEYNIYYKLFSVIGTLAQLALTPVWSMVTKAIYEKSYDWLKNLYWKIVKLMIPVALVQLMLVVFLQVVVDIWLGGDAIEIKYSYAVVFALWGTVFTFQNALSTFVCGLEKMKLQVQFYSIGVIAKFVLMFFVYQVSNQWIFVVIINIAVMIPYCLAQHYQLFYYFKCLGNETGEVDVEK